LNDRYVAALSIMDWVSVWAWVTDNYVAG
jgi:hypothetical protein